MHLGHKLDSFLLGCDDFVLIVVLNAVYLLLRLEQGHVLTAMAVILIPITIVVPRVLEGSLTGPLELLLSPLDLPFEIVHLVFQASVGHFEFSNKLQA